MEIQDQEGRQGQSSPGGSERSAHSHSLPGATVKEQVSLEELRLQYGRLLKRWSMAGGRGLKVDFLQAPGVGNNYLALARAEALGRSGKSVGYGSAHPGLVGSTEPGVLLECAELLAKVDALSAALRTMPPLQREVSHGQASVGAGDRRTRLPFGIPPEVAARQQIDLTRPPQGEGAKIYQYLHSLIQQMEQRSRQIQAQDLGLLEQVAQHQHDLSFYTYTQALLMVSHAIEDEFIQKQITAPFYAGFQYLSRLRPQEPRYRAILHSAQRVLVFGIADWSPWYDLRLQGVALDVQRGMGLERFWFIATRGPDWNSALLAEHLAGSF